MEGPSPCGVRSSSSLSSRPGWVLDDVGSALRAWSASARPPPFAVGGSLAGFPYPSLTDGGAGEMPLPLAAVDVRRLVAAAEPAPFGRGADTVVDPAVRVCQQVKAAAVTVGDDAWVARLAAHVRGPLAESLGIPPSAGVTPRRDKLVLYETGGFAKPHTDTEKEAGMVGTLVLQLPVVGGHTGGVLSVKHAGECLDFDGSPPAVTAAGVNVPAPRAEPPALRLRFFCRLRPRAAPRHGWRAAVLAVQPGDASGGGGRWRQRRAARPTGLPRRRPRPQCDPQVGDGDA